MTHRSRQFGGTSLILIALVITLTEFALHLYAALYGRRYNANYTMLFVATVIGFSGMYILSPSRAKDGGRFLVDSTIKVIQVIRNGRRKEDLLTAVIEDHQGHTAEIAIPTIAANDEQPPVKAVPDDIPQRRLTDLKGGAHERGD